MLLRLALVVLPGLGAGLASCESWDEGPPPSTAAASAGGPTEPLPPGPPIPAPPSGAAADAPSRGGDGNSNSNGETQYASGEYAIGEDTDRYQDSDPAALRDFRAPLAPYGEWTDDPTYGSVWVPSSAAVGADFTPYVSSGHWAYDDDYVWVSDYSWGWAPFHYGRWVFVDGRGWAWIPGREYRGAWVTWSVDDGYSYLGWAPMGPAFVWFGGMPVAWHGYWGPRWAYVPRGEVFSPRVGARVIVGPSAVALSSRMRVLSAEGRVAGPPPARFGYAAAQVPRVTGAAAVSVRRAQEFSRPSTARALGASAASVPNARVDAQSRSAATVEARGALGPRDGRATPTTMTARPAPGGVTNAPRTVAPGVTNAPRSVAPGAVAPMRAPPQEFHSGPTFHSGGHRR